MKKVTSLVLTIGLSFQLVTPVQALTIELSNTGNGTRSTSTVSYKTTTEITVSQQNISTIDNQITQTADTGSNSCGDDKGDCRIETGEINSRTSVENRADHNQAKISQSREHVINAENSDNGQSSDNLVETGTTIDLKLTQKNETRIQNSSGKELGTGGNTATDNSADVVIKTGSIYEGSTFSNGSSKNDAQIGMPGRVEITASNSKNAQGSSNQIRVQWSDKENIEQHSSTKIVNQEDKDLNTGDNHCRDNTGSCRVITGSIKSSSKAESSVGENDLRKGLHRPTPTITPTPTKIPEEPTPPRATPAPTVAVPSPAPTKAPQGAPLVPPAAPPEEPSVPTPVVTKEAKEQPSLPKSLEEVRSVLEKFVPQAQAAERTDEGKPQVLGVTSLPLTGVGFNGRGMPLSDVFWGLTLILGGLIIRRGVVVEDEGD